MSDLHGMLAAIEADLDASRYRVGSWNAFLRVALRRPRNERLLLAADIGRVSRKLHRRNARRIVPVGAGVALEILATVGGGALLWIGFASRSNLAAVGAAVIWVVTFQPLLKLFVGRSLAIRYDYAYLGGGVEPRFKMSYGTFVAAPAWARVTVHLAGTVGSPLAAWLVGAIVRSRLPAAAAVCMALFTLTLAINALLFFARLLGVRRIAGINLSTSSGGLAAAELRAALGWEGATLMQRYDSDPKDGEEFTASFDRAYTRFARLYDVAVRRLPVWKTWLRFALPHLRGPRVLEVSFGTGYLMTQFAQRFEAYGVDYNAQMVDTARQNLLRAGADPHLCRARVEALPYADGVFDTILNTMALSGYPDARAAISEMQRVLRPGGRLVLIDVNYPDDENVTGRALVRLARMTGDLVRDVHRLLAEHGFAFTDRAIGGCGSVHLYVAEKAEAAWSSASPSWSAQTPRPTSGGSTSGVPG